MNQKIRRVCFKTLGCKLNQAETESIATGFKSLGWQILPFGEEVDAVVINSCTVTNSADRKTRAVMNQALRIPRSADASCNLEQADLQDEKREKSPPLVVMTGCHADAHRDALEADGRTYVLGNDHKSRIPALVDAHFKGEMLPGNLESDRDPFGYPLAEQVFRTRAMIKIQDGCDNFCTFCIIPFVRGRGTSRPLRDCVQAVEAAASSGYREIVLTGVNMSRWNEGKWKFSDLMEACLNAKGDFRLRLGSVEPDGIDEKFFALFDHPKMTNHLHLCLQSGSDKILLAMRRQYNSGEYRFIASRLRQNAAQFNLTTDVIVGFPGENEEDFEKTRRVCEQMSFGHIHTFPYSRRNGTRADRMPDQVSAQERKVRAEEIRRISANSKRVYRKSLIGTVQEVLVERSGKTAAAGIEAYGLTSNYVPLRFTIPGSLRDEDVLNRIYRVKAHALGSGDDPELIGTVE